MPKSNKSTEATVEKAVKKQKNGKTDGFKAGIMGLGMALVVVSIAYSCTVIYYGTEGLVSRIMLAPQFVFGLGCLGYAFSKTFK